MMKKTIISFLLLSLLLLIGAFTYLEIPFVSDDAIDQAVTVLKKKAGKDLKKGSLIIVDYSQPSHTKRLAVMNLKSGVVSNYSRVAHGKNSGVVLSNSFSNKEGSLKSSIGLFKVADSFDGKHGPSLRLIGLDPEKNGNALKRGIIIHTAPYVSTNSMLLNWKNGFRLGRSAGCFVLSRNDYSAISNILVRPAYLYSYAANK